MRSQNRFFLLLILLLWWSSGTAAAQNAAAGDSTDETYTTQDDAVPQDYSSRPSATERYVPPRNASAPTEEEWNNVVSDRQYKDYKDEREDAGEEEQQRRTSRRRESLPPPRSSSEPSGVGSFLNFFTTALGAVIMIALLVVIIGAVVYYFVINNNFRRRNAVTTAPAENGEPSEEDLQEGSWEDKMRAAMQTGNYRLAIRYGYLLTLQLLQRRDLILYRPDKTNTDYYRELADKGPNVRPDFRTLTRAYEFAWYSGAPSTERAAEEYFSTFNALKSGLQ